MRGVTPFSRFIEGVRPFSFGRTEVVNYALKILKGMVMNYNLRAPIIANSIVLSFINVRIRGILYLLAI